MHTIVVIAIGFLVLGVCLFLGYTTAGPAGAARAALYFVPIWFMGAATNMYIGVKSAGYAISEEMPVLLLVFAIPAAVALLAWWKLPH
jgi:hypothetical protein